MTVFCPLKAKCAVKLHLLTVGAMNASLCLFSSCLALSGLKIIRDIIVIKSGVQDQVQERSFVAERLAAFASSPDGTTCAGGGISGSIFVWDTASGRLLRTWPAHYQVSSLHIFLLWQEGGWSSWKGRPGGGGGGVWVQVCSVPQDWTCQGAMRQEPGRFGDLLAFWLGWEILQGLPACHPLASCSCSSLHPECCVFLKVQRKASGNSLHT